MYALTGHQVSSSLIYFYRPTNTQRISIASWYMLWPVSVYPSVTR